MSNRIQGTTSLTGLLGYPARHSKSPDMQNTAFEIMGLDYVYLAFEIRDGFIKEAVDAMKALNAKGFNVTMPHKQKIIPFLDGISEEARIIGAVNTVVNDRGRLIGYNTDGKGYTASLIEKGMDFKGKKIVIAGSGGAAGAIAIQLAYDGAGQIVMFNRTFGKAQEIMGKINKNIHSCEGIAKEMNEKVMKDELEDAYILINCTSLGMGETLDQSIVTRSDTLHKELFVSDVIYNPPKTKFMSIAEEAGCKTMNGLGMLLWQGAIAFKIWTGMDMPIEIIKKEVFGLKNCN